jgi:glycine cleavage system H protein
MTRAQTAKSQFKNALLWVGLAMVVVVAIPVLAGLAFAVRLLVPLMLAAVVVGLIASPAFRRWFMAEADSSPSYHGVAMPTASLWVHPAHAWATIESSGTANVGIDALALTALGEVTAIQAPAPGAAVEEGRPLFTLCHGERKLEVKAPVSGTIVGVNPDAVARPALLKESPYGAGWVVRLTGVEVGKACESLKHGAHLRRWWRHEVDRLVQQLGSNAALPTMADGGVIAGDLSNAIDDRKWNEIARELFGQS